MRTLFMFDAHIIRKDPWCFRGPVGTVCETIQRFGQIPSLWQGLEPKLLLTKFNTSETSPHVIRLPIGAERALRSFSTDWNDAAIDVWRGLMRDEGVVSEIYRDILQYLVTQHGIECFAYWGSNNAIRNFCDENGLQSVAMELGPTRSPFRETRYCDFMGVNGDAHVRRLDWRKFPPMDLSAWRQRGGLHYDDGSRDDAVRRPLTTRFAPLIYRSDKPIALVAMQLDDDSNCLIHSRYSGMREMIEETVPALVTAGWRVLVKPHPGAAPERNRSGARIRNVNGHADSKSFIARNFSGDDVVWLDDVPTDEYVSLLGKIDALVSVNSSMGFEAMLMGRVVVALGTAPYNIGNGLPTLSDLTSGHVDGSAYGDYVSRVARILLDHYLYPVDLLSSPTLISQAVFRNRALCDAWGRSGPDGLTRRSLENPIRLRD